MHREVFGHGESSSLLCPLSPPGHQATPQGSLAHSQLPAPNTLLWPGSPQDALAKALVAHRALCSPACDATAWEHENLPEWGPSPTQELRSSAGHLWQGLCSDRGHQELKPSQSTGCTHTSREVPLYYMVFPAAPVANAKGDGGAGRGLQRVKSAPAARVRGQQAHEQLGQQCGWGWGRGWCIPCSGMSCRILPARRNE